ncbi:MAG: FHA domain-containing protein [Anaerolineae bacterium]
METLWAVSLAVAKYAFLGLIYLILIAVVLAVRREMQHSVREAAPALGRLKIAQAGSDPSLHPGQVLALQAESRIGADHDNEIVLGDRYVSAHHARLRWDEDQWRIEDLGSSNGTQVDGRPCAPGQEVPVPIGATVEVGDVVMRLLE